MSIEAMRQALEVLEQLQGGCTDSDDGTVQAITVWCPEAITALRAAIEQAQEPEPVKFNCTVVDDAHPEGVPLSQWGQQQKQKPFCYHDGRNIVGKEFADHSDVFPLYTRRQAREPLTDEQIIGLWQDTKEPDGHRIERFARAIEAAHGIGEKK